MFVSVFLTLTWLVPLVTGLTNGLENKPQLQIIDHTTCDTEIKKQKTMIFPSNVVSKLEKINAEPGCYKFGGTLKVSREIEAKKLQIYLQLSHQPVTSWENNENWLKAKLMDDGSEPQFPIQPNACQAYDDDGCGGYGSCVYCHSCENHLNGSSEPSIEIGGKSMDCNHKFSKGIHKDVYLKFCLPSKAEFFVFLTLTPKNWQELKNTTREFLSNGVDVFIKIYIFDVKIYHIHNSLLKRSHLYRLSRRNEVPGDKAVPWRLARRIKWNKMMYRNRKRWIGCHYIHGNIRVVA